MPALPDTPAFIDTNVLIYAQQSGPKGDIARAMLADGGIVSIQVLNEFASVSARKLGRTWPEIGEALADLLAVLAPPVPLTLPIHTAARALAATQGVSFYDALIVAAAQQAGCSILYSEDLQAGRRFANTQIVNPFAP